MDLKHCTEDLDGIDRIKREEAHHCTCEQSETNLAHRDFGTFHLPCCQQISKEITMCVSNKSVPNYLKEDQANFFDSNGKIFQRDVGNGIFLPHFFEFSWMERQKVYALISHNFLLCLLFAAFYCRLSSEVSC